VKQILVYIILAFFLFNSLGYFFLFELEELLVEREMAEEIQERQIPLVVLRIAGDERDAGFRRTGAREIEYNGDLYDIVREYRHGDVLVFYCLRDSREEQLLAGLKTAQSHKLCHALWEQVITIPCPCPVPESGGISVSGFLFPRFISPLHSAWLRTWSPPPKDILS